MLAGPVAGTDCRSGGRACVNRDPQADTDVPQLIDPHFTAAWALRLKFP